MARVVAQQSQPPAPLIGSVRALLAEFVTFAGKRQLAFTSALILAAASVEGFGILLLAPFLQHVLEHGGIAGAIPDGPARVIFGLFGAGGQIAVLFMLFAVLMTGRALLLVGRDTQLARLQLGFVEATKRQVFEQLSASPWTDVTRIDRARLIKVLGSDMVQISYAVNLALLAAAGALMVITYSSFALMLSPRLSLLTFALLASVAAIGRVFVRRAGESGQRMLLHDLRMTEDSCRFLTGLKLAKAQDLQQGFVESFAAASHGSVRTRLAFIRLTSTSRQLAALLGSVAAAAAILVALNLSGISTVTLIAFCVLLARTAPPAAQVLQSMQQVAHCLPVFAEVRAISSRLVDADHTAVAAPATLEPSALPSSIGLEFVSLTYPGDARRGLDTVSLCIRAGEFVGLSGPTGSGKTTLLDVIAFVATPDNGQITLNERTPDAAELSHYRSRMAYVAADPVLFAGSIRSNLAWMQPAADDAAMWTALRKANADELVDRLGHGLDSPLADAGSNLSAGERQQMAFARAWLRQPLLWLLDEATCSLDANLERQLLQTMLDDRPRPTVLLISHRAESLALCDRVLTLCDGSIVDDTLAAAAGPPGSPTVRLRA